MDAEFSALIEGTLSNNAQVARYVEIIRDIEKEIQEQDENATNVSNLGRTIHISGYVNHSGGGQSSANSNFTSSGNSDSAAYNPSSYSSGDMTSGDQAVVDSVLSQVNSLSDAIIFNFEFSHEIINYIIEELGKHSPFKTGRYMHSHILFADGLQVEDFNSLKDFSAGPAADATEFLFVNTLPYARKIEAGESPMAPSGVYEIVAHEAQDRYGSTAIVDFIDYTGVYGVMAEATRASYGHRTKLHMNKSQNRFPAIRLTFPNR